MPRRPLKSKRSSPKKSNPRESSWRLAVRSLSLILKPSGFSLDGFRSKRSASIGGVATLLASLPIMPSREAKDLSASTPTRPHTGRTSCASCNVPTKGVRGGSLLHLILEDLACAYLPEGKIIRHRLALASKPDDVFFLAEIPTTNLDNSWNVSNLEGCELGKTRWVQLTSQKNAGQERYKIDYSRDEDAFPEPTWLTAAVGRAYRCGVLARPHHRHEDHPGLLRLIGAKQQLK